MTETNQPKLPQTPKTPPSERTKSRGTKNPLSRRNVQDIKISSAGQGLIGVFILAAGLAAVAAVGYLAYSRFSPPVSHQPALGVVDAASAAEEQSIAEQPKDKKVLETSGLDKAGEQQFLGSWVARNGSNTVYALLKKDKTFEIVVFMDREGYERRYSAGTYSYNEDQGVLTLKAGFAPLPTIEGVRMKTLTQRAYGVIPLIDKKSGELIWVSQNRGARSNVGHPIFTLLQRSGSYIVWSARR